MVYYDASPITFCYRPHIKVVGHVLTTRVVGDKSVPDKCIYLFVTISNNTSDSQAFCLREVRHRPLEAKELTGITLKEFNF